MTVLFNEVVDEQTKTKFNIRGSRPRLHARVEANRFFIRTETVKYYCYYSLYRKRIKPEFPKRTTCSKTSDIQRQTPPKSNKKSRAWCRFLRKKCSRALVFFRSKKFGSTENAQQRDTRENFYVGTNILGRSQKHH